MLDQNLTEHTEVRRLLEQPNPQSSIEFIIQPDDPLIESLRLRRKFLPQYYEGKTISTEVFRKISYGTTSQTLFRRLENTPFRNAIKALNEVLINEVEYGIAQDNTPSTINITWSDQYLVMTLEREHSTTPAETLTEKLIRLQTINFNKRLRQVANTRLSFGKGLAIQAETAIPLSQGLTWKINYKNTSTGGLRTTVLIQFDPDGTYANDPTTHEKDFELPPPQPAKSLILFWHKHENPDDIEDYFKFRKELQQKTPEELAHLAQQCLDDIGTNITKRETLEEVNAYLSSIGQPLLPDTHLSPKEKYRKLYFAAIELIKILNHIIPSPETSNIATQQYSLARIIKLADAILERVTNNQDQLSDNDRDDLAFHTRDLQTYIVQRKLYTEQTGKQSKTPSI